MRGQTYRAPGWLELCTKAPGVDPQAVELHNRLNSALVRGDTVAALRWMRELNQFQSPGNRPQNTRN